MIRILICALGLLTSPAWASQEYTRDFQKTVAIGPSARVEIDNQPGDVLVRARPGGEICIRASIKASGA